MYRYKQKKGKKKERSVKTSLNSLALHNARTFKSLSLRVQCLIGYFFVWRRERDSSGGTGAVPPPARGTKKTSTGRFFASLRSAVPFESLPLSLHKQKKHPYWVLFCLAQRKGFEPLLRFPVNTISSRAPSTSSAISASRSNIIQHFFVHCKRNLILRIKIV